MIDKNIIAEISQYAGQRKDYVQGGGGNTSVKLDDRLMAIKASGYTLLEVTPSAGYVTVDYPKIRQYYETVDPSVSRDYEKESLAVNMESIVLLDGMDIKRPSVEVGFHAFLKKCVIHTHSVYANVLCCCEEGQHLAKKIFADTDIRYAIIRYTDPGFRLTLKIRQALEEYKGQNGEQPDVIFMENHGMITHGDDAQSAIQVHERVNDMIRTYFNLPGYPEPKIKEISDGFMSDTGLLFDFIARNNADEAYFNSLKLYPDLLVYVGGKFGDRIQINQGRVVYYSGMKEAQAVEETLLGAVYVVDAVRRAGLNLRQMDERGAGFIKSWESEKYRIDQMKGK